MAAGTCALNHLETTLHLCRGCGKEDHLGSVDAEPFSVLWEFSRKHWETMAQSCRGHYLLPCLVLGGSCRVGPRKNVAWACFLIYLPVWGLSRQKLTEDSQASWMVAVCHEAEAGRGGRTSSILRKEGDCAHLLKRHCPPDLQSYQQPSKYGHCVCQGHASF